MVGLLLPWVEERVGRRQVSVVRMVLSPEAGLGEQVARQQVWIPILTDRLLVHPVEEVFPM